MTEGQSSAMLDVGEFVSQVQPPPCRPTSRAEPGRWKAAEGVARREVERAVLADVIPSVGARMAPRPRAAEPIAADAVELLVQLLVGGGGSAAVDAYLEGLVARGVPLDGIFLRLFQPAARRLGELWLDDICSFVDVTLALSQLQRSLRTLAPAFHKQGRTADGRRWIVLVSLPGDQHTFGLAMMAEFFRRGGWTVQQGTVEEAQDLIGAAPGRTGAVLGFSASGIGQLDALAGSIHRLRRSCGRRLAGVLVGGPLAFTNLSDANTVGAEAVSTAATQGLVQAEALLVGSG